ncbi:MAG TPA: cyclic nucleotide-binding domain-containing protein [Gammaproteobacteria bacterium]|jgi:CRP-like cAMP-binding protein|nr:cyclic nucleotide-binding domain-containing protein [Gammaproteobacteria bacterium]
MMHKAKGSLEKNLIRQQPFFAKFAEEDLGGLSALFEKKTVKAGETIVREGDPVDYVYLIVRGTAEVKHLSVKEGKIYAESLALLKEGGSIGLSDTGFYALSGVRTATVDAVTDMTLLRLSKAAFNGFVLANRRVSEIFHQEERKIDTH